MTNQPTASGVSEEMIEAMRHEQARCVLDGLGWESEKAAKRVLEAALSANAQGGDDGRVPERESAWLVERAISPPQYISHNSAGWHSDPWQAHRFKTEREAHDYWRLMPEMDRCQFRVIEHMFINKVAAAPPQPIPTPDEAGLKTLFQQTSAIPDMEAYLKATHGMVPFDWTIAAMSRVAALSRARPEEAIREAALEEAAKVAELACLVPPDGGSPSEPERLVAEEAAHRIRALKSAHSPAPRVEEKEMREMIEAVKQRPRASMIEDFLTPAEALAFGRALMERKWPMTIFDEAAAVEAMARALWIAQGGNADLFEREMKDPTTRNHWEGYARSALAALKPFMGGDKTASACAAFVGWALSEGSWEGCDLDGGAIQTKAQALGLLKVVPYDPVEHEDAGDEYGVEPGEDWFTITDEVKALLPASPDKGGE